MSRGRASRAERSQLQRLPGYESYNYSSYGYTYDENGEIAGQSGPQHVEPVSSTR